MRKDYNPGDKPLLYWTGESIVRVYMGGAAGYLFPDDGILDFFPVPTQEGRERIAPNECWIIQVGHPEDESGEEDPERGVLALRLPVLRPERVL